MKKVFFYFSFFSLVSAIFFYEDIIDFSGRFFIKRYLKNNFENNFTYSSLTYRDKTFFINDIEAEKEDC